MHTLAVRNWGTPEQVKRICSSLYAPLDDELQNDLGFSPVDCINIFYSIVKISEKQIGEINDSIARVARQRSIERMVKTFHSEFSDSQEFSKSLLDLAISNKFNQQELFTLLLSYIENEAIASRYFVEIEKVSVLTGLTKDRVNAVISEFCITLEFDLFYEWEPLRFSNPFWDRPLLRIEDETVFSPIAYRFFHDPKRIIEKKIKSKKLLETVQSRRSDFLEHEVERLFRSSFPKSVIVRNISYSKEDQTFEADLLVQVDSTLFIVEAKSSAVSDAALRGAPDRMRREVKRLISNPSMQSDRFRRHLEEFISNRGSIDFISNVSEFRFDCIRRIARISVTLDDLATLQSQVPELQESDLINPDLAVAPTFLISDIEMVFDILENESMRFHYLVRRAEIQRILLHAHEAEWLQFYLNSGFNIGEVEGGELRFQFPFGSELIDQHYHLEEFGISRRKPKPKISKLWVSILNFIEERRFDGWTEYVYILLSLSIEEQDEIIRELTRMRKNVPRFHQDPDHKNTLCRIPRTSSTDALAFLVVVEANYSRRTTMMEHVAATIFENNHINRCLVITKCVERWKNPYDVAALYFDEGGDAIKAF